MTRRYHVVQADVFTDRPFGGNQLAVFTDARGLTAEDMQTLAREMNYSESTFVLPSEIPRAAKRVRIFTPYRELPMAGHPTVGTAYVLAQRGEVEWSDDIARLTLQLGIGPVPVTIERRNGSVKFIWMAHREAAFGPIRDQREAIAYALGLTADDIRVDWPIQIASTGLPFLFVPLRSLDAAKRCQPNEAALKALLIEGDDTLGLYTFTTETASPDVDLHVRMFSPAWGITEDAATGSGAAPMGAYAARYQVLPRQPKMHLVIEQGVEMQRPSLIHVEVQCVADTITAIRIGGQTVIVGEGEIFWE
jgi:trans-2,3-dihydro-3-hydroxyanthranilate isomerase